MDGEADDPSVSERAIAVPSRWKDVRTLRQTRRVNDHRREVVERRAEERG